MTSAAHTYYVWKVLKSAISTCKIGEYIWIYKTFMGDKLYSTPFLEKAEFFLAPDDAISYMGSKDLVLELKTVSMIVGDMPDETKRATQKMEDAYA